MPANGKRDLIRRLKVKITALEPSWRNLKEIVIRVSERCMRIRRGLPATAALSASAQCSDDSGREFQLIHERGHNLSWHVIRKWRLTTCWYCISRKAFIRPAAGGSQTYLMWVLSATGGNQLGHFHVQRHWSDSFISQYPLQQ